MRLASLPTPLYEASNLSKELGGPGIFIKRDDLTGLAFGGNKTRILEFIMGDAKAKGADVIVTGAGWQSNWLVQVLAAARRLRMDTVVYKQAVEDDYDPQDIEGNALLHLLLGGEIKVIGHPWREKASRVKDEIIERLKNEGRRPYDAGESPFKVVGYANGVLEMAYQANEMGVKIDYIAHASGSGMTQSGLILGTKGLNSDIEVVGIAITPRANKENIVNLVREGSKLLNLDVSISDKDVTLVLDYVDDDYAVINEAIIEAIKTVARTEGIFLDPVYTGKAMSGLIEMIRNGRFDKDENVVFLHTGGTAGLFPFRRPIKPILKSERPPWLRPPWYYK